MRPSKSAAELQSLRPLAPPLLGSNVLPCKSPLKIAQSPQVPDSDLWTLQNSAKSPRVTARGRRDVHVLGREQRPDRGLRGAEAEAGERAELPACAAHAGELSRPAERGGKSAHAGLHL